MPIYVRVAKRERGRLQHGHESGKHRPRTPTQEGKTMDDENFKPSTSDDGFLYLVMAVFGILLLIGLGQLALK